MKSKTISINKIFIVCLVASVGLGSTTFAGRRVLTKGGSATSSNRKGGKSELEKAVQNVDVEAVKRLLDGGANANEMTAPPIQKSLLQLALDMEMPGKDATAVITLLYEHGAKDPSVFAEIASRSDSEVAKLSQKIIAAGDKKVLEDALMRAVDKNDVAKVKVLLQAKANPKQTVTAVKLTSDFQPMLDMLLAAGADINAKDGTDMTALMHAAHRGDVATAKYLLSKGAKVNIKGMRDMTAIDFAKSSGGDEMVTLLSGAAK